MWVSLVHVLSFIHGSFYEPPFGSGEMAAHNIPMDFQNLRPIQLSGPPQ